jgi:hypothetical protein
MGDDSEIFVGIDVASQLLARALASISFNRSSSSRLTVTSLRAIVSISRCARIIAWAGRGL